MSPSTFLILFRFSSLHWIEELNSLYDKILGVVIKYDIITIQLNQQVLNYIESFKFLNIFIEKNSDLLAGSEFPPEMCDIFLEK